ncbi:MAG: transcriptional regulator NrdR [Elusimicrobiota bacterium]
MKCPFCRHNESSVVDSRPMEEMQVIRRRRECLDCHKRFTTYERLEELPLLVIKSGNRRETFDRNKLREGILRACEKRPIATSNIERMVREIESELEEYVLEVSSRIIGEKALKKLKELDEVAYIRFASVYKQFNDLDAFMNELKILQQQFAGNATNKKNKK